MNSVLCANTIPHERREFLERHGIECKEIGLPKFEEVAKKVGYEFIEVNKIQGSESVDQKNIVSSQGVVLNNHEMFADAVKKHRGEILSTPEISEIVCKAFPQFSKGSLLPNDHGVEANWYTRIARLEMTIQYKDLNNKVMKYSCSYLITKLLTDKPEVKCL